MNRQPDTDCSHATVFVVDDERIVRTSLHRFLKSHGFVAITFASAAEFLEQMPFHDLGCVLLDLQMPSMTGLELQQELIHLNCDLPIIFLTAHGDIPASVRAIKHGAEDFLSKMAEEHELLEAINRALDRSRQTIEIRSLATSLTDREREVCQCVISGMLNKQIARKLDIVERTVKAHRAKVMEKLRVESVAELVRVADAAGIHPIR